MSDSVLEPIVYCGSTKLSSAPVWNPCVTLSTTECPDAGERAMIDRNRRAGAASRYLPIGVSVMPLHLPPMTISNAA
ncbi:MAG: hypothetical protein E5W59_18785 [Mesorhizobium sp.]|nr:MAG: hypothetical protein E5W59_18785 [Mesorhizobium sp.]